MEARYNTVKCSIDEGIALVVISRPESLNALNRQVFTELGKAFDELRKNDRVRVVILTGEGEKAFAAGSDITEMQKCSVMEAREFAMLANKTQGKIGEFPKPVIAAINGFALGGGCEVAMACDIRIASTNAKFGQPEINVGLIPGGGGTQRLARLVGIGRAKELVYSGEVIDAERAYELGLVNKVVSLDKLITEARKLASNIASKSLPILMLAKTAFNCGFNLDLDRALEFEIECFADCFGTEDHNEGMLAFIEKRKPAFRDK
ncbi:MAG: enoyl-CoA hydratase/isomerase family protein [Deltaproteobacteria bacterium]|nr:enoyl-CoA hydratase/isomerase family protein [Deltaproteobacteria bacterium]